MKKLLLSLLCLVVLVLPTPSPACEYDIIYKADCILTNLPHHVITGINSKGNLVSNWKISVSEYQNVVLKTRLNYKFSTVNITRTSTQYPTFDFPLTIYVSALGWTGYFSGQGEYFSPEYNNGNQLQNLRLEYRVFPSLDWVIAATTAQGPPSYNAELWASYPDKTEFAIDHKKEKAVFGSYCIDVNVPEGTLVQLRLVSEWRPYYTWCYTVPNHKTNELQYPWMSNPATYYESPITVFNGRSMRTNGDFITITAGKRRPRHDK